MRDWSLWEGKDRQGSCVKQGAINLHSREDLRCLLRPVRDCIDRLLDPSALEAEPDILEAAVANVLCEVLCARVEVKQDLVMIGHWILGTE